MIIPAFIYLIGNIVEFACIVLCMDVFISAPHTKNYRLKLVISLTIYTLLSAAINFAFDEYKSSFILTFFYIIKFTAVILLLYNTQVFSAAYVVLLIDFTLSFFFSNFSVFLTNFADGTNEIKNPIVNLSLDILLLLTIVLIKHKTDNNKIRITISTVPKHVFVLILLTIACLGGIASVNKRNTENIILQQTALNLLIITLSLLIISIVVSLIFNVILRQRFSSTAAILEKQIEVQLRHYEKLEEMDNEMRKFRHDYINHMQSILSLIKMGEYADAEEYILKLQNTKHKTESLFVTGNKLSDAIITDKSEILSENTRIDYQGVIPADIANMDLCIILSNSLDNAIEACSQCDFPCVISVTAAIRQGYFVLTVKNPTVNPDTFYDIPPTSKSDKNSHGIGLTNIKDTAVKNGGRISIKCENHVFELSVILKI